MGLNVKGVKNGEGGKGPGGSCGGKYIKEQWKREARERFIEEVRNQKKGKSEEVI